MGRRWSGADSAFVLRPGQFSPRFCTTLLLPINLQFFFAVGRQWRHRNKINYCWTKFPRSRISVWRGKKVDIFVSKPCMRTLHRRQISSEFKEHFSNITFKIRVNSNKKKTLPRELKSVKQQNGSGIIMRDFEGGQNVQQERLF